MKRKATSDRSGIMVLTVLVILLLTVTVALVGLSSPDSQPALANQFSISRASHLLNEEKIGEARWMFVDPLKSDPRSMVAIRGLLPTTATTTACCLLSLRNPWQRS